MPRPDTSEVSESDVEALFGTDGEAGEEPEADEVDSGEGEEEAEQVEGEEEPSTEDEESEEGEEAEDEESEEEPGELDWSDVDPRVKQEYDTARAEAQKWKRDYGKLQSKFTERGQAQKTEERELVSLRQRADYADKWDDLLAQYPDLQKTIEREVARIRDPMQAAEVPDYLKSDPAFQYMQKTYEPVIRSLQQQLAQAQQIAGKVNSWEADQQRSQSEQKLNGLLEEARGRIKTELGRDATEAEITEVLKFMVDNNYYRSGKIAAAEVFGDRFEKAKRTRSASTMRAKAGKFPARAKSVNPGRVARNSQDANSIEEAIARSLADQGHGLK